LEVIPSCDGVYIQSFPAYVEGREELGTEALEIYFLETDSSCGNELLLESSLSFNGEFYL